MHDYKWLSLSYRPYCDSELVVCVSELAIKTEARPPHGHSVVNKKKLQYRSGMNRRNEVRRTNQNLKVKK
jgi:hypothetical protein